MKPAYKCLHYLENGTLSILEVKRTDLPAEADASEVFKWLYVDKALNVIQLWFCSMDASGDIEERFFDQGYLKFNAKQGTFIEKFNSAQHQLVNKSNEQIPSDIALAVQNFLQQNQS